MSWGWIKLISWCRNIMRRMYNFSKPYIFSSVSPLKHILNVSWRSPYPPEINVLMRAVYGTCAESFCPLVEGRFVAHFLILSSPSSTASNQGVTVTWTFALYQPGAPPPASSDSRSSAGLRKAGLQLHQHLWNQPAGARVFPCYCCLFGGQILGFLQFWL